MPRGGWLHEVRRWACCGLRFWGVFIIAVHRAFVLGLGARHRGIVELSEGGFRCVTVFACFVSFFFFFFSEYVGKLLTYLLKCSEYGYLLLACVRWLTL